MAKKSREIQRDFENLAQRLKLPWLRKKAEWDNYAKYDPSKNKIKYRS